jgi:DMSO/TMAO reductase YedYZ molybdopterin-dependent catalytic subunit
VDTEIRPGLPRHQVPAAARKRATSPHIEITGLVEYPQVLTTNDLSVMPRVELADSFHCDEGWSVPNLVWQGVSLSEVLACVRPLEDPAYLRIIAGPYAIPLQLTECSRAILACELNGKPLPIEHGGPWRLIAKDAACFTSVKWVERLELTAEAGENTGKGIAMARLKH